LAFGVLLFRVPRVGFKPADTQMNPLLFANLGTQRRLLQSGTAFGMERVLVNVLFGFVAVGGIFGVFVFLQMGDAYSGVPGVPDSVVFAYRVLPVLAGLVYTMGVVVTWALIRVFLDMADASVAISLGGPEREAVAAPAPAPRPRAGGESAWPERPRPLVPFAEAPKPEDVKYMPGGG
jgi:hypothetical protein